MRPRPEQSHGLHSAIRSVLHSIKPRLVSRAPNNTHVTRSFMPQQSTTSITHDAHRHQQVQGMLIKNWSTQRYKIEYRGYLSNHLLHGVVALLDLGASDDQLKDFATHYAKKLEQPDHHGSDDDVFASSDTLEAAALTEQQAQELIGKRENYDGLLAFYGTEIQKLGIDGAVKKHLPTIVGGLAGSLLHGIIQLGYSYHIGGERLVAEGLAYLHFSYMPFDEPKFTYESVDTTSFVDKKSLSKPEALQLLRSLSDHGLLRTAMYKQLDTEAVKNFQLSGLQRKLVTFSAHPTLGNTDAFQLIWETINRYDLSNVNGVFMLDLVLWAFTMIEHNDFVIAHGVTSAWSLKQLEHLLSPDDRVRVWKVWLHVILSAYITREIQDLQTTDICCQLSAELPNIESWETIVKRTLAVEGYPDEHLYKVVQVAYDHATNTTTSQLPDNGENAVSFLSVEERDFVARKSALKVLTQDFDIA